MLPGDQLAHLAAQQMKNVSTYSRRIRVPTLLPMAVKFPRNNRKLILLLGAPLVDGRMRLPEERVGAEVDGGHHTARWQLGAMNSLVANEWL
jgi:hypothetical protein